MASLGRTLAIALLLGKFSFATPATPPADPAITKNEHFGDISSSQSTEKEILSSAEFLEFSELDTLPKGLLEWTPNHARFLYLAKDELPYVYFAGKVKPGVEVVFNDQFIGLTPATNEFSLRVPVRLKPTMFQFRFLMPNGEVFVLRLVNHWLKLPSTFSYRIKTSKGITDVGESFHTRFESTAFAQLYALNRPVQVIDLDSIVESRFTFRFFAPPKREEVYDGWALTIFDGAGNTVQAIKRFGYPPEFIDWRELTLSNLEPGDYSYRITLFNGGKTFHGASNSFHAFQGMRTVRHDFFPALIIEPRGQIGYLLFSDNEGIQYNGPYVGGELTAVIDQRFLIRGRGLSMLSSSHPSSNYASAAIGGGLRFFEEERRALTRTTKFRLDVLGMLSSDVVYPSATQPKYTMLALVLEPQIAIQNRYYLAPWIELASHPTFQFQSVSTGVSFDLYLRTQALRVGLLAGFTQLIRYPSQPASRYSVIRVSSNLSFRF